MTILKKSEMLHPRLLVSITRESDEKKLEELFETYGVPIFYQCRGKGTAPSEMLDIFGLGGTTRLITMGFLPRHMMRELFCAFGKQLSYHKKGGGIAFSLPIKGLQMPILELMRERAGAAPAECEERTVQDMSEEKKQCYSLLWVSVKKGFSEEVVDVARAAGARGGTVLKGRRSNSEEVKSRLGISLADEQEFIMILVQKEKKSDIMAAISNACGLKSEAQGVVLSMPVEDIIGLQE